MAFFASAIDTLKILVIALGAGLGAWGQEPGHETAYGWRRYCAGGCHADSAALRPVRLIADGQSV